MTRVPPVQFRRWTIFGLALVVAVIPAELLTGMFADPDRHLATLFDLWGDFLVGPVRYWLAVLLGQPSGYALHPMAGLSTWVYAVCLPLAFAHPLKPHPVTGVVTVLAFAVWYGWAFLTFGAYNCPC